jgi:hypothetical protein
MGWPLAILGNTLSEKSPVAVVYFLPAQGLRALPE